MVLEITGCRVTSQSYLFPFHSLMVIALETLAYIHATVFDGQPQFTIKAERNKMLNDSYTIAEFVINDGNIAHCLEHCIKECKCQSFQICSSRICKLCSKHKKENNLVLHDEKNCTYFTYEMPNRTETIQVLCFYILSTRL